MKHHGWIIYERSSDADLTALRDYHSMPDLKPRKTMTQKEQERQELRDAELAYVTAGGCIDYRDEKGMPAESKINKAGKPSCSK